MNALRSRLSDRFLTAGAGHAIDCHELADSAEQAHVQVDAYGPLAQVLWMTQLRGKLELWLGQRLAGRPTH